MKTQTETDPRMPVAGTAAMADLQAEAKAVRERLAALRHQIVDSEAELATIEAALVLETNEQIVAAALRAEADATRCKDALKEAEKATEIDSLTGLPNRAVLLDRLAVAMNHADRHGHRVALLFVDLDNFKEINDTAGHAAGDDAIHRVAAVLTSSVRVVDTVSRHGGDEFLILLSEITAQADAVLVAEKIGDALSKVPLEKGGRPLSASIGISVYPEHGTDPKTLIERADKAMYSVKRSSIASAVYEPDSVSPELG